MEHDITPRRGLKLMAGQHRAIVVEHVASSISLRKRRSDNSEDLGADVELKSTPECWLGAPPKPGDSAIE